MTAATKETTHGVGVGAIFVESWGYDQTNIDYYEVIATTRTGVRLRKIGAKSVGFDRVEPAPGEFITSGYSRHGTDPKGFWKKVSGHVDGDGDGNTPWINMTSYSGASLWEGGSNYETPAGFGH